ncbi:MAG: Lrp/AsnC family transcriptional regulator [Balneolaceae bacterium]|nr:Lrp/AsnC family transcriptional regulator [Balneolaceae bacterium]
MSSRVELDKTDVYLLNTLSNDGRKSFTELAQELNASVGMVRNRYKRLVDEGVLHIIGWTDPVKSGMNSYARIVMKIRPTEMIRTVAEQVAEIDEVSFVALTTGNYDLEINVTCQNNSDLLKLMHSRIHTIKGVFETSTTMYMEILKWASHQVTSFAEASDHKNPDDFVMTDTIKDEH